MDHFTKGVNLGGWLSQYRSDDHEHFRTFITRRDIEQIAGWGFDHIRLPVDYPVLESDDWPGVYREEGFQYVDACMEWCQAAGLGVVFDLHRAPGYSFAHTLHHETQRLNTLFTVEADQQRFISLWQAIVSRYQDAGVPVIFELLNEVVLPDSAPWNRLVRRTLEAIRSIAPRARVMIGSNQYNAAAELRNLELFDDHEVCYTFHFYEPLLFTHQRAPWVRVAMEYNQPLEYPGTFTGLREFLQRAPEYRAAYEWLADRPLDRDLLREFLRPAHDFVRETGRELYCGEFGVIGHADPGSRRRWYADLLALLREDGIGWAVWSYKQMSFGLVDHTGQVVDPLLLDILCQG
ncbi:MAG: glycoside hydrolase family 5 protein [Anaerolineae bacterium]|nr:glycoside hydrolase family 5 protein [Anaerolineae bacterium]